MKEKAINIVKQRKQRKDGLPNDMESFSFKHKEVESPTSKNTSAIRKIWSD